MARCLAPDDLVDGRFRIVRLLGAGGMGEVYEAQDELASRRVALKVLLDRSARASRRSADRERSDVIARERLLREGQAASRVSHPSVVSVLALGHDDERDYVVMELLHGEDLGQRLEREGPLPVVEVERLLRELAGALSAMHELGIVHRDLKPKNLFLAQREGEPARLKVLDFGLAKAAFLGDSLTDTQQVFGTLNYLSPEQLRSATFADARSDLWALGAIVYEALVGHAVFFGSTAPEVVLQITTFSPPALHTLRDDVSRRLSAVVRRALQRDPAQRFQSARELLLALDGREPLADELDTLAALDALTGSLTDLAPYVAQTNTLPVPAVPARARRGRWWAALAAALVAAVWLMLPTEAAPSGKGATRSVLARAPLRAQAAPPQLVLATYGQPPPTNDLLAGQPVHGGLVRSDALALDETMTRGDAAVPLAAREAVVRSPVRVLARAAVSRSSASESTTSPVPAPRPSSAGELKRSEF